MPWAPEGTGGRRMLVTAFTSICLPPSEKGEVKNPTLPHYLRPKKLFHNKSNAFERLKRMNEEVLLLSVPFRSKHFDMFWHFSGFRLTASKSSKHSNQVRVLFCLVFFLGGGGGSINKDANDTEVHDIRPFGPFDSEPEPNAHCPPLCKVLTCSTLRNCYSDFNESW